MLGFKIFCITIVLAFWAISFILPLYAKRERLKRIEKWGEEMRIKRENLQTVNIKEHEKPQKTERG